MAWFRVETERKAALLDAKYVDRAVRRIALKGWVVRAGTLQPGSSRNSIQRRFVRALGRSARCFNFSGT